MAKVLDRIAHEGFNVEIYDDGDCIFELQNGGYLQVSVELLRQIAQKTKGHGVRNKEPVSEVTSQATTAHAPVPSPANTTDTLVVDGQLKYSRKINQLPSTPEKEGGWEVWFSNEEGVAARQVYVSRGRARESKIDTLIGEGGRIE